MGDSRGARSKRIRYGSTVEAPDAEDSQVAKNVWRWWVLTFSSRADSVWREEWCDRKEWRRVEGDFGEIFWGPSNAGRGLIDWMLVPAG